MTCTMMNNARTILLLFAKVGNFDNHCIQAVQYFASTGDGFASKECNDKDTTVTS